MKRLQPFLVVMMIVVSAQVVSAGLVHTKTGPCSGALGCPAVVGDAVPDAGAFVDGACIFDLATTEGVEVDYWPSTCEAFVSVSGDIESAKSTQRDADLAPLWPAYPTPGASPDPAAPTGKPRKKGNTKKMDPSFFGTPAPEPTAIPPELITLAPQGETQSVASSAFLSCPRNEWYQGEKAKLSHWYAPHGHYHALLQLTAHSKFWQSDANYNIGEVHPMNYPSDWAAWVIGNTAFGNGWRFWFFSDIAVTQNGPYEAASRATAAFRSSGYFTSYSATLTATAASDLNLRAFGNCNLLQAALDPAFQPYRTQCYRYVRWSKYQACYY